MNSDMISGKWQQLKGDIKAKWAKLTDDDLGMLQGKREHLVGKIVERYGVLKHDAEKQVDEWAMTVGHKLDSLSEKVGESTKEANKKRETHKEGRS